MQRTRTSPTVDKEVFRRTAAHARAINLGKFTFRGGIRL